MEPTTSAEAAAHLFRGLRGGRLRNLTQEADIIRFQVLLPQVASVRNPDFTFFYCTLKGCSRFSLQPFRNTDTRVEELSTIERLDMVIHSAKVSPGPVVSVLCGHKGVEDGARLTIRSEHVQVWDEAFDPVTAPELERIQNQGS
ncbi:MAG: hypothetical protein AAGN35_01895 [Bacteroidota bacterium]